MGTVGSKLIYYHLGYYTFSFLRLILLDINKGNLLSLLTQMDVIFVPFTLETKDLATDQEPDIELRDILTKNHDSLQ